MIDRVPASHGNLAEVAVASDEAIAVVYLDQDTISTVPSCDGHYTVIRSVYGIPQVATIVKPDMAWVAWVVEIPSRDPVTPGGENKPAISAWAGGPHAAADTVTILRWPRGGVSGGRLPGYFFPCAAGHDEQLPFVW